MRITSLALGIYYMYTVDNREIEKWLKSHCIRKGNLGRKLPKMAIRLGFLIENFLYNYIFKPFVEITIQILIFLSAMLTLSLGCLWINHYPVDNSIGFASVYPLEYP